MSAASAQGSLDSQLPERWASRESKRILTIDGPLDRLPLLLGWLKSVESVVRTRTAGGDGADGGLLADYFDLIAGSGGGAVVAAMLAQGSPCRVVEQRCERLVSAAISGGTPFAQLSASLLDNRWLRGPLASIFGTEARLAGGTWRTGVCLHAFRLDSCQPHAFHNHPGDGRWMRSDAAPGLADVLEGCLALPPHPLPLLPVRGETRSSKATDPGSADTETLLGAFGDARLGMAGGAASSTWGVACGPSHPFRWAFGEDRLLMVSVGGGYWTERETVDEALKRTLLHQAARLPEMLIADAARQERWLMESVARTPMPRLSESGSENDGPDRWFGEPGLTWVRYDLELDSASLSALGFTPEDSWLQRVRRPGGSPDLKQLQEVGMRAATAAVNEGQFPVIFDPPAGETPPRNPGARKRAVKK
jgi:uncharacterized protein